MMYAPKKLFEQLKELYFDNLFDNNICDYKKIKTNNDKIVFVYCDKSLFEIKDKMDFPSIYIDIQQFNGQRSVGEEMLGRVSAGVGGREWFIAVLWKKRAMLTRGRGG